MRNDPLSELRNLYQDRYVSYSDLQEIVIKYRLKSSTKRELIVTKLKFLLKLQLSSLREYSRTTGQLYKYLNCRNRLNQKFIKREQAKLYRVEGNRLDPQQIAAVVACEDAELILAPAGSGKTASLLAKIDYLINVLKIPASQILVIAFTNKVVAELKDRIPDGDVEIRTFHSLGNKIIKSKLTDYHLISEQQTAAFFHRTLKTLHSTDQEYAKLCEEYLKTYIIGDAPTIFGTTSGRLAQDPSDISELEPLFISTLGLQKNEHITLPEFKLRLQKITDPLKRTQALKFYHVYATIASQYTDYLNSHQLYDFADMLNRATTIVRDMPKGTFKYQYILVDEAQDLSSSKHLLLKAILDNCEKTKLFAVGDDWQSIYRFAGSNLSVLDDFERIFQRQTYRGLIELTYRFGQPTAHISNRFIQKNPHQSKKRVTPHVKRTTPIIIKLNTQKTSINVPPDYELVDQQIQALYHKYQSTLFVKTLQIISRYNRDVFRLVHENTATYGNAELCQITEASAEFSWFIPEANQRIKIPFCSIHKAKGITRDIIFVINVNSGSHGIPATRGDDPVTEILLSKPDPYPFAEERRLFYVAITRAKERTIIFSHASSISPFVFEINPKLTGTGVEVCPRCHKGILVEHVRRDGKVYYSCSNFTDGCKYSK